MADEKRNTSDTNIKEDAATEQGQDFIWLVSNRKDDRVVLHERDPRHPGGEVFIGGPTPDKAFKTAEVVRLLHSGEAIEIPEPPKSRKKPIDTEAVVEHVAPAQPGQAIGLGRAFDPELVPAGAVRQVQGKQNALPRSIASKALVPPPPKTEKDSANT